MSEKVDPNDPKTGKEKKWILAWKKEKQHRIGIKGEV